MRRPASRRAAAVLAAALVAVLAASALALAASAQRSGSTHWRVVHHGGTADLRAISPLGGRVAWASGSAGTVLRTLDGGRHWANVGPRGTAALEFRGLKAFDARHALLMSVGAHPGDFRIYLTRDGGRHWRITNRNRSPQAFYDCMAFFDRRRGLVLSDPVNGRFRILITSDGGRHWRIDPARNMPPARAGEYGFAASNTCITTSGRRDAWFGSGGPGGGRVFRSTDGGRHWQAVQTPMLRGASAGVFALAFRGSRGIAAGGDFARPAHAPRSLAITSNGGRSWRLAPHAPGQYRSGAAWVPGLRSTAVVVGLTGSDISRDGGRTWRRFDRGSFDAVACSRDGHCWASGADERIGRLVLR